MRQYRFYNIHNFVTFMIQENESSWSRIQIDNNMKAVKYNYKKKTSHFKFMRYLGPFF